MIILKQVGALTSPVWFDEVTSIDCCLSRAYSAQPYTTLALGIAHVIRMCS